LCYTEIVRGKYDLKNLNYILKLFNHITIDEKQKILSHTFENLWNSFWVNNTTNLKREFNASKIKFNSLKNGYLLRNNVHNKTTTIDFKYIVENTDSIVEPEWEFPKGRRKPFESDLVCALREFEEETSISKTLVTLDDHTRQYEEVFIGKNKFRYKNIFFLGKYAKNNIHETFFNPNNLEQIKEIRDVKWFDHQRVLDKIKDKVEKKEMFSRIHSYLNKQQQTK